jgi:hypothetical protein
VPDVDILKYYFMVKAMNIFIVLTWRWTQGIIFYGYNEILLYSFSGYAVAQLDETLRYKQKGSRFDFRWVHLNYSLTSSSNSNSDRNEYQSYLLE